MRMESINEMRMEIFNRMFRVEDKVMVASIYQNLVTALIGNKDVKEALIFAHTQIDLAIERQRQEREEINRSKK